MKTAADSPDIAVRKLFFRNWKYLNNIPPLPNELTQLVIDYCKKNVLPGPQFSSNLGSESNTNTLGMSWEEADNIMPGLAQFQPVPILDELEVINHWIKQNFNKKSKATLQVMSGPGNIPPHIDIGRKEVFNYLIDTGGNTTETCFYKVKPEFRHLIAEPGTVISYDRIYEVEQITLLSNRWHALNVQTIHGVKNISTQRIAISVINI
jgi:hypothetical protein